MSYRISLLILLMLFACSEKSPEDAPQSYPLETARMVSHVSAGVLASTDPIRVRFVSPVIGESQVGQVLRTRVFRFVPSIDGLATWEDVRTLVFKPNAPLALRAVYSGELNMTDLFPQHKDLKPLVIQFEIAGRELVALKADVELPDANDPQRLVFSGQISFNERSGFFGRERCGGGAFGRSAACTPLARVIGWQDACVHKCPVHAHRTAAKTRHAH